jgi:hypothetical protein
MSALDSQVSGNHYKVMKMQPIELAYRLHGSPCFCKLAKYLTRDKGDKLTNLKKAKHCIQLEAELLGKGCGQDYVLNYSGVAKASRLIYEFTDNPDYQTALEEMYHGFHENAVAVVDKLIKELE